MTKIIIFFWGGTILRTRLRSRSWLHCCGAAAHDAMRSAVLRPTSRHVCSYSPTFYVIHRSDVTWQTPESFPVQLQTQVPTSRTCKILNLDRSVCFISEIPHWASCGRAVLIKTNNSVSSSSRDGLKEEGKWTLSRSRANGRKEPFLSYPEEDDEDSFSRTPCTAVWEY